MDSQIIWDSNTLEKALSISLKGKFNITGVSIDSRKIKTGDLFIGIQGENYNGGEFAIEAIKKGASLAIIERNSIQLSDTEKYNIIEVDDTFAALDMLAKYKRAHSKAKFIAITGSVGKTSTKEMLKIALQNQGNKIFANDGNLNNQYGTRLSLANLEQDTKYCILEIGMSRKGEIEDLSLLVRPDIALITEIAAAHLEFFNSVEDIARAKAEVFIGMEPNSGIAILNCNSQYYTLLREIALSKKLKILSFGSQEMCDAKILSYHEMINSSSIEALCFNQHLSYQIAAKGMHIASNSLGVLCIAYCLNADLEIASKNLAKFNALKGRGQTSQLKNGITLIDESYNANPMSMSAAIAKLGSYKKNNSNCRLIAILGDMKELGDNTIQFHKDLLPVLIANKIDKVFTVGIYMEHLFKELPENTKVAHFQNVENIAQHLIEYIKPNDIMMLKGSFSINMSIVVSKLLSLYSN